MVFSAIVDVTTKKKQWRFRLSVQYILIHRQLIILNIQKSPYTTFSKYLITIDIQGVSKRMTRFQIIISNNENVLQLQNKLQTIQ